MAKLCPITETKVLYLECLECEDKVCKNSGITIKSDDNKKENIIKRSNEDG